MNLNGSYLYIFNSIRTATIAAGVLLGLLGCSEPYLANNKIEKNTNPIKVNETDHLLNSCANLVTQEQLDNVLKYKKSKSIAFLSGAESSICLDDNGKETIAFEHVIITPNFRLLNNTSIKLSNNSSNYSFEISLAQSKISTDEIRLLAKHLKIENPQERLKEEVPIWQGAFINELPNFLQSQSNEFSKDNGKLTILFNNVSSLAKDPAYEQINKLKNGHGIIRFFALSHQHSKSILSFDFQAGVNLDKPSIKITSVDDFIVEVWNRINLNREIITDESSALNLAIKRTIALQPLTTLSPSDAKTVFKVLSDYSHRLYSEQLAAISSIYRDTVETKNELSAVKNKLESNVIEFVANVYPDHPLAILKKRLHSVRPLFDDEADAIKSVMFYFSDNISNNSQESFNKAVDLANQFSEYIRINNLTKPNPSLFTIATEIRHDEDQEVWLQTLRLYKWLFRVGYKEGLISSINSWHRGFYFDDPRTGKELSAAIDLAQELYDLALQASIFKISKRVAQGESDPWYTYVSSEGELNLIFTLVFKPDSNPYDFKELKSAMRVVIRDDFPSGPAETAFSFFSDYSHDLLIRSNYKIDKHGIFYDINPFYVYTLLYRHQRLAGFFPQEAHQTALKFVLKRPLTNEQKDQYISEEKIVDLTEFEEIDIFLKEFLGANYAEYLGKNAN